MDTSIAGTDEDVYQYMVSHGISWISEESIMTCCKLLVSSYLTSQENIREVIKIEEVSPISDHDPCFSGATEDTKDVYTSFGEEYMTDEPNIYNTQFPSNTHPMLHEKLQKTEKPYKCDQCDKQFTTKTYLKQHQFIHQIEKSFKCDQCDKQFSQRAGLKQHEFIHKKEKPFKCDQCDKQFAHSSHLKYHQVVHTGVKAFKCDECGKQFSRSTHLKQHQVIHTGVKAFKCDECGKQFSL